MNAVKSWIKKLFGRSSAEAPAPIACREVVELVTMYLDGSLPDGERARFEAHLGECPHCTEYLKQFRMTIAATGQLREADLEPDAREVLVAAFRNWKASPGE